MTEDEALDIVISLATDNMADAVEMPEIFEEQARAIEMVTELWDLYVRVQRQHTTQT